MPIISIYASIAVQTNPELERIKKKETPKGLKLLLTFDNVKSVRRALELMELL